jgi:phosphoribosylformylglycinamidine cyclo-ligase
MNEEDKVPSSYAEAGVDLRDEATVLNKINYLVKKSFQFGDVLAKEGHYANLVKLGNFGLALATDGVGTKLIIAQKMQKYDTVGIDCVAMNVNDLLAMGIMPKAFVDYLAVSEFDEKMVEAIVKGIVKGCEISEIPLLGGELAKIPELLAEGDNVFDLAGTALGIIEENKIIDGSKIEPGDVVIGISSNGIHSNGFTIARKVLGVKYDLLEKFPWDVVVGEELLKPTRIYVRAIKHLLEECKVNGLAHITGGGLKKLFRLTEYGFELTKWMEIPSIFEEIRILGKISFQEMFSIFNMGVGFIIVIPRKEVEQALSLLNNYFATRILGEIISDPIISLPEFDLIYTR